MKQITHLLLFSLIAAVSVVCNAQQSSGRVTDVVAAAQEVEFRSADVTLSGTLLVPSKMIAALVLVHGSGKEERDVLIAEALARNGVAAYSADREHGFHANVNAWGVSAAAAADVGSSVHDEIDNVLGSAAIATYLCPGLAEGGAGAQVPGSAPGGLPRSAVDSARQAAYGQIPSLPILKYLPRSRRSLVTLRYWNRRGKDGPKFDGM